MSVTFNGETWMEGVGIYSTDTVIGASASLRAVNSRFREITLTSDVFSRLSMSECEVTGDLTLNGGANAQSVGLANVLLNNGDLIVNGTFDYGFKADVRIRDGNVTCDGLTNAVLNLLVQQTISASFDDCHRCQVDISIFNASQHGLIINDSSDNRFTGIVADANQANPTNTYDGIRMTGDSNRNRTAFTVVYDGAGNQMRYGMNIVDATCDDNVEASILTGTGATGNFNDAGTGTVLTDDHIV